MMVAGWVRMLVPAGVGIAVASQRVLTVAAALALASAWYWTWALFEDRVDPAFAVLTGARPQPRRQWEMTREIFDTAEIQIRSEVRRRGQMGQQMRHARARARGKNTPLLPQVPQVPRQRGRHRQSC